MANHPSKLCRACEGRGWSPRVRSFAVCQVCNGRGRITIAIARMLRWLPIVHKKRGKRPEQLPLEAA
jgi:DnaJ-class molecular chaperone